MRTFVTRFAVFVLSLFATMMTMLPTPVVYAVGMDKAIISHQATLIQRGQVVEDVVVLGHDVVVAGDVSEILVVINGDIHLTSSSRTGIVIDLGGTVRQDVGAHVNAVYQSALSTPFWNGALFGGTFALVLWLGMLAVSIGLVILSVLLSYALRHQVKAPLSQIERSGRRVGMTGVFASLAILAMSALCAVTIVGLPLAGLLLLLYLTAGVVGFSIVALWLGKLALRHSPTERPVWLTSLIGASLLMAFTNIPFVGLVLFLISWLMGIGTITAWLADIWRLRRGRKKQVA